MVREVSSDFLRIDINQGKTRKIISACQNETVNRTIHFLIVNNGVPVDLSNLFYAEILIHRVDGTETDNPCIIDGDDISYTLRSNDISVVGENEGHIYLTFKDGTTLETPVFYLNVFNTLYNPAALQSQNEYNTIVQQALNASNSASDAAASATAAATSATDAAASAISASNYADNASDSADAAEASATASATSAMAASTDASTATTKATAAAASAEAALGYKTAAETAATTATNKATAASNSADSAASSSSTATTKATAASNSADAAAASASTASNKASVATQKAQDASDFADAAEQYAKQASQGGLELGETQYTAYRGDRGKQAFDDSQINKAAIGILANLLTTSKSDLVVAINSIVSSIGSNSGIASLDSNGKVPGSQLPSYVDDVIEGYYNSTDHLLYEESTFVTPISGESGKIYIGLNTELSYRWSGSIFTEISQSLALGETSSTAYRGDRGKQAYEDSQANKAAIGDLANLTTTDKSSLSAAINELKSSIADIVDMLGYPLAEPSNNE